MIVTCPTCKASLTIPDERLPAGAPLTAACPKCKGRLVIEPGGRVGAAGPEPATAVSAPARSDRPAAYRGRPPAHALVCVSPAEESRQVAAALEQAGYVADAAGSAAEAVEKLRFTPYAVAILRDGFGTPEGEANPVLEHIAEMGMAVRRNLLVVFLSPSLRSHNAAAAFARSVNLVLNVRDLPHLTEALEESRLQAERAYRVLHDALQAMGRA